MASKLEKIVISDWGDKDLSLMLTIIPPSIREIGLKVYDFFSGTYDVIDEHLFMLAVIKHGIKWEPISENIVLEKVKARLESCR